MARLGSSLSSSRRSRVEWGVRAGLAGAAAVLGFLSVTHSMALVAQTADPKRAHALAPYDGRITATFAERAFAAAPLPEAHGPVAQSARRALRQDPTAVKAAATLGLQAQLRGDTVAAQRLIGYAQRLSRRELQVQLWAVENAVARGDIPDALRHYDIALRTSNDAPDLLFPVLGGAIAEPAVRRGLIATLATRPIWSSAFIDYVATSGVEPGGVADLLLGLRGAGVAVSAEASRALVAGLIRAGSPDKAWRYYAAVRGAVDRRRSRDAEFTWRIEVPTPFDWVAVNEAGITASIEPTAEGGFVDFSVSSSIGGEILRQMQALPVGRYRITGKTRNVDQPARSAPYWTLICWQGRELGRVAVSNSKQANGMFAGTFTVPADCPVQTLSLVTRASDAIAGVAGQLDRVQLSPAL